MKYIYLKKASEIPETSIIKVFINGKMVCKINNYLKYPIEIPDDCQSIDIRIQWQWCGCKKSISVRDGMALEITPNKFVNEKYRLMALIASVIILPLSLTVNFVFFSFLGVIIAPPIYYITFSRNKYLIITEL